MNRLARLFGTLPLVLSGVLAAAQTVDHSPPIKQAILDQVGSILAKDAFVPGVDFSKWHDFVNQEKGAIDDAKNDDDFQQAVNLALKKFGASHTVLNSPRLAGLRLTGDLVGVGFTSRVVPDGLLVTRTIPDAPAERGGIVPGDIVVKVDSAPVDGTKGIDGPEGTDVTLTVRHVDKSTEDYILTRRKFTAIGPEEMRWLDKDTVLLKINTFGFSYDRKRVAGFISDAANSKNLILDLRGNGGGEIGNFRQLLGLLLPRGKAVGTFINRTIDDAYVAATHGNPIDLKAVAKWTLSKLRGIPDPNVPIYKGRIVVLIDSGSGSASEIVAQGLRDTLGAVIVGTKSAGMVLVSQYVDASNGFMLQYPLSDYVTIKGERLEGMGVTPDVVVKDLPFADPQKPDPVITAVLAALAAHGSAG